MRRLTSFLALSLFSLLVTSEYAVGARPPRLAPESAEVVVVGAGLAGLVAAYELQKAGIGTHLLEAEPETGGRVATVDYGGGLIAEYGMQEIWASNPLRDVAAELGVALELSYEHCAHSTFMHDGEIYRDTGSGTMTSHWDTFLAPNERAALTSWLAQAKKLLSRAVEHGVRDEQVRALQDMSYEAWVTSSPELSPLARTWLRLHLEAELGSDWRQVSALFALLEMEIFFDGGAACYAVKDGSAKLIEALTAASGPLTTSARVTAIKRHARAEGRSPVEVSYIHGGQMRTMAAQRVVLAIPFYRVGQILMDPPLSSRHHRAIQTLGFGEYVSVHVVLNADATTLTLAGGDDAPDVVLTNGPLGYVYGFVAENRSRAVFSTLVYGRHARRFHRAPRSTVVEELLTDLDATLPGFKDNVISTHVYTYHPAAIARWGPGRSPIDELSMLLRESIGGLYLAGDYTLGAHSDSAVRSGMRVAQQIVEELRHSDR